MNSKNTLANKLNNAKWDAIHSIGQVRDDLFDHVTLSLSRIEGKLKFLNSESLDGDSRFVDNFSQRTCKDITDEVAHTRKALDEIFLNLNEAKNSLINA